MIKLKVTHKGKIYKYLITFGDGNRIYGRGSDRIMIDKLGRFYMGYNMDGEVRFL